MLEGGVCDQPVEERSRGRRGKLGEQQGRKAERGVDGVPRLPLGGAGQDCGGEPCIRADHEPEIEMFDQRCAEVILCDVHRRHDGGIRIVEALQRDSVELQRFSPVPEVVVVDLRRGTVDDAVVHFQRHVAEIEREVGIPGRVVLQT